MDKRIHLLVVDPQNDFCDLPASEWPMVQGETVSPALAVSGGHQDMRRLASFIDQMGARLQDITVTLDSHPYVAIERTTFWADREGQSVPPFTVISADSVVAGDFVPLHHADLVVEQLRALERAGRYQLVVWPVHCVTGTWGHNIHAGVANALAQWELQSQAPAQKILKGEYPWSEHYGAFEAEVPLASVPSTQFNETLARRVTDGVDVLLVAGEASSHCVAASVDQLLGALSRAPSQAAAKTAEAQSRIEDAAMNTNDTECSDVPGVPLNRPQIVLLTDCMSPVGGFEPMAEQFFQRAHAAGVQRMTAEAALAAYGL